MIDSRLAYGGLLVWEAEGELVSMAARTPVVGGMSRVAPVYTPPAQRGNGYGGAVTVATSQAARAAGAREVVLFTDLANPTSNALYQRLGFRPVSDRLVLLVHGLKLRLRSPAAQSRLRREVTAVTFMSLLGGNEGLAAVTDSKGALVWHSPPDQPGTACSPRWTARNPPPSCSG